VFLLARDLVTSQGLGTHEHPDLLALGFSALDMVGHVFGPDSPEYLDTILRLDRELGELFDFLEDHLGGDGLVIALSSDHGVLPIPESPTPHDEPGRHFTTADVTCMQNAGKRLSDRLGQGDWLLSDGYLDRALIAAGGLDEEEVERAMADILESCDAVEKVWTRSELTSVEPPPHPLTGLVVNNYHPQRSPDLFLQLKPGILGWIGRGTTHGSPYEYDRHVPMIFMLPGGDHRQVTRPVRTVDLAPTLAAIMGLTPPEGVDGRDLTPWIFSSASNRPD
jgi:arylsulfatase A-like enzyme